MFTLKPFLRRASIALLCMSALCACGDNDGDEPDNPIDPNKEVSDPTGTVSMSMRSENGASSPTRLGGGMYINEADNFTGRGIIVDLGAVKGLGNVSAIPKIGYANQVKVTPSHGYVYCEYGGNFYRIFVTDYIVDTGGGIIGADVKYQAPFYGKDEELKTDDKSLSFKAEGGETDVVFTNSSIIPFKVESDQPWCKVRSASTLDLFYLTDAIHIAVDGSEDTNESKAEITVTTLHGKTTKIAVTRLGVAPTAQFNDPSSSVDAPAGVYTIPITTNMNLSDLSVKSSESWAKVSLVANATTNKARTQSAKWIGNEKAPQSQNSATAITTYYCRVEVDENTSDSERAAEITLSSKDGKISSKHTLSQKEYSIDLSNLKDSYYDDKNGGTHTLTIKGSLPWDVSTSDANWCTVYRSGNNLAITTIPTTQNRQAVVTITAGKESFKITVYQTKWATGDKNGDATVQLNEGKSFIYKFLPSYYAWSTQQFVTGAVLEDDGEVNTKKIHSIPNWQSLFPAFVAIENLNTNGESGWYMPAINELILLPLNGSIPTNNKVWSSTEQSNSNVYTCYPDVYSRNVTHTIPKINTEHICAAKRFDAYKIE